MAGFIKDNNTLLLVDFENLTNDNVKNGGSFVDKTGFTWKATGNGLSISDKNSIVGNALQIYPKKNNDPSYLTCTDSTIVFGKDNPFTFEIFLYAK